MSEYEFPAQSTGTTSRSDEESASPGPSPPTNLDSRQSIAGTNYASSRRALNALINSVRSVGAQLDVDLPRISVIGVRADTGSANFSTDSPHQNQSAGKSSLVEAISEIKVPRDAGTCTRCPFEVRLQNAPDVQWTCQVMLRLEYDEGGSKSKDVHEIPFGRQVTSPEDVEDLLRRAQLAILNPRESAQTFVTLDLGLLQDGKFNDTQLSFSKVCLVHASVEPHSPLIDAGRILFALTFEATT